MQLIDLSTGRIILARLEIATTPRQRMRGLLGRTAMAIDEGMYFPQCRMIHTFFMQMPIDVIFLDHNERILDLHPELKPWRIAFCRRPGGCHTLELSAGGAAQHGLAIGAGLIIEPANHPPSA